MTLRQAGSWMLSKGRAEQGLTSHQTHRSYRWRVLTGQMTPPTVSKHWRKIRSKGLGFDPIRSTPPCYNNTTHMQYEKKTQNTQLNTHSKDTHKSKT